VILPISIIINLCGGGGGGQGSDQQNQFVININQEKP
jgi:hypothetical protein